MGGNIADFFVRIFLGKPDMRFRARGWRSFWGLWIPTSAFAFPYNAALNLPLFGQKTPWLPGSMAAGWGYRQSRYRQARQMDVFFFPFLFGFRPELYYIYKMELDFEIDKITESIENVETGESFTTFVLPLDKADLKQVAKKNGWRFGWRLEFAQPGHQVYKLVTEKEPNVVQGLVSLEKLGREKIVFMPLIESAPFNVGTPKTYEGVCGNLVAYGCKLSKEYGFDGYVSFDAKTVLIEHYIRTLRAKHYGGLRMGIEPADADWLINSYFPQI
jgi:hypothetical protein